MRPLVTAPKQSHTLTWSESNFDSVSDPVTKATAEIMYSPDGVAGSVKVTITHGEHTLSTTLLSPVVDAIVRAFK
jgi:hypothetical protein